MYENPIDIVPFVYMANGTTAMECQLRISMDVVSTHGSEGWHLYLEFGVVLILLLARA